MMRLLLLSLLAACGSTQAPLPAQSSSTSGRLPDGQAVRVAIKGDKVEAIEAASDAAGWIWPVVVDSHVHLAYWDVADRLAASGVGAAVDLAAPERDAVPTELHVLSSGPMLTHVDGYPLDAWGSDGYGIGCADAACVTRTVEHLAGKGVRVIKLALDGDGLDPALVPVAVSAAHAKQLPVAAHALSDASAMLAAQSGVDILAHTPTEPLAAATVAAWGNRTVISTLAAFGGAASTVENLRQLRAAGATVLYGTDLGNTREAGPSAAEIDLLRSAGLDDAAITAAMTTAPLAYWKLPLAEVAAGAEATFLVLDADPRTDAEALVSPREVWLRGKRLR
jgi:imidazolonepropionase-like amidohydrolase